MIGQKKQKKFLGGGRVIVFCSVFLFPLFVSAYTLTPFPSQNLCVTSFPTAYVAGSFSIAEGTVSEFGKNQVNKTLFFDLPAGFAYNTTAGTYTVTGLSGNDISVISVSAITASRITVSVRTTNTTQIDLNTITVSCEIRATAAGTPGNLIRNGGNFKIAGSSSKPTTAQSLGSLYAQAAMTFTSSTVTQPNVANVGVNTIDDDVIRIEVVVSGTCAVFNVTQLDFNTLGDNGSTNPAADITTAKVYYTGTTGTFAPVGLFGSLASPNGAFSITGSQVLSPGTNYFWLAYDIPATATINNYVDAQCSSVTMNGGVGAKTPTVQNPVGGRKIYTLVNYYSLGSSNWNVPTNWSYTSGGPNCGCFPSGSGNVFIDVSHTITLNISTNVDYITVNDGATLTDNGASSLTINSNLNTFGSGKITPAWNWTIIGNVALSGTGASVASRAFTVQGALTIGSGTSLTGNGGAGSDITLQGDLFLDGTLSSGAAGATIIMNGAGAQNITASAGSLITGTGVLTLSTSDKNISSISVLTVSPDVAISGGITVTNNGTMTLDGNLTGTVAGSTWTNAANSSLTIKGATLLTTGTLNASASPNTVDYNGGGAQTITVPSGPNYYNLTLSNSGTKTFAGSTGVTNMLTLSGSAIGDVGTNTLNGAGGVTMSGSSELKIAKAAATVPELTGLYALTGGTITLNQGGATTQTAAGISYYNLKLAGGNASSVFNLAAVTSVANNFDIVSQSQMTSNGILFVGGNFTYSSSTTSTLNNTITVIGSSAFSVGSFNANGNYFTTGDLTLSSGTLTGGASTIEVTTGNWTNNGGTFVNTGNTVLFSSSSSAQTIGGSAATTYNNLTLNNTYGTSPQIIFGADQTVNNTLTMTSGIINLAGYTLTLGSAGVASTLSRAANTWVYGGTFKRNWLNATAITSNSGNYYGLFPMGESTAASYSPLEINTTANPTADGTFSVAYSPVPGVGIDLDPTYNDGGTMIERILNSAFITTVSGVTGGTYNIDVTMTGLVPIAYDPGLQYRGNNSPSPSPQGVLSDIRLAIYTGGTTASAVGTHAAATGTVSNPTAKRTGLAIADLTTKDFRIATSNKGVTPLPVEFLMFEAVPNGDVVDMKWSTAVEFNSDYFMVQRSKDGVMFEDMVKVNAAGNSSTIKKYFSEDSDPYSGVSYYRLKQFDLDGKFGYSNVVAVDFKNNDFISVYPSPASGPFNIILAGQKGTEALVVIRDMLGREFYSKLLIVTSDKEVIAIDPAGILAAGVYIVVATSDDTVSEKKVVIK